LPEGWVGTSHCAAVRLDPKGEFLIGSNRGHDTLVVFRIAEDGTLTTASYAHTEGEFPRDFGIDPSGSYVVAANQNSRNMMVFKLDRAAGKLIPTGQYLEVPFAVCIEMIWAD